MVVDHRPNEGSFLGGNAARPPVVQPLPGNTERRGKAGLAIELAGEEIESVVVRHERGD